MSGTEQSTTTPTSTPTTPTSTPAESKATGYWNSFTSGLSNFAKKTSDPRICW